MPNNIFHNIEQCGELNAVFINIVKSCSFALLGYMPVALKFNHNKSILNLLSINLETIPLEQNCNNIEST